MTYRVQFRKNLTAGSWVNLPGLVTATNGTAAITDATCGTNDARFTGLLALP